MQSENLKKLPVPVCVFKAENQALLSVFPDGPDELWSADIKEYHNGILVDTYEGILFVESGGTAYIYGIECESGCPEELSSDLALKQKRFIQYLRDENIKTASALGVFAKIFEGSEYAKEGKVTAAYITARGKTLNMGIGYYNEEGTYERMCVDPSDGWL